MKKKAGKLKMTPVPRYIQKISTQIPINRWDDEEAAPYFRALEWFQEELLSSQRILLDAENMLHTARGLSTHEKADGVREAMQYLFTAFIYAPLGSVVQMAAIRKIAEAYDLGDKQGCILKTESHTVQDPVDILRYFDELFPEHASKLYQTTRRYAFRKCVQVLKDACMRFHDARSFVVVEKMRQFLSPPDAKRLLKKARRMRLAFDTDRKLSRKHQIIEDVMNISKIYLRDSKDHSIPEGEKRARGDQEAEHLGLSHLKIGLPHELFAEVNRLARDERRHWNNSIKYPSDGSWYRHCARTIKKARKKKRERALSRIKDPESLKQWSINQLRLQDHSHE